MSELGFNLILLFGDLTNLNILFVDFRHVFGSERAEERLVSVGVDHHDLSL
jgi:hypothetical protein